MTPSSHSASVLKRAVRLGRRRWESEARQELHPSKNRVSEATMATYYVNKDAQSGSGDHEVHTSTCSYLPGSANRVYLGEFSSCSAAVDKAKKTYSDSNGCYHCSRACHTT